MTETKFAMVSEWMSNGNINQFVTVHQDANRFELVSFSFKPLRSSPVVDDDMAPVAGRRREGLGLCTRSGDAPWRS